MTSGEMDNELLPVSAEELQEAILQETTIGVAVKSEPILKPAIAAPSVVQVPQQNQKSIKELSKLGSGTFSIDKDTAKNMASGKFVKRVKIKRCGKCKVCYFFDLFKGHFFSEKSRQNCHQSG